MFYTYKQQPVCIYVLDSNKKQKIQGPFDEFLYFLVLNLICQTYIHIYMYIYIILYNKILHYIMFYYVI